MPIMPNTFQKLEGNTSSTSQLATIDTLKGICMVGIFFVHFVVAWHAPEWPALARFLAYILDFVGPAMFATMSTIGHMISLRTGTASGESPYSARRLLRISFLVMYGEYLNAIVLWRLGIFLVTAWNVVLAIAIFALVIPQMMRLNRLTRLAIAAVIMVAYYPLANGLVNLISPFNHDLNTIQASDLLDPVKIIYWIFFCHDMMSPIFSWMLVPLLVSVVFDSFATQHAAGWPEIESARITRQARMSRELGHIAMWGIAMVVVAVLLSLQRFPDYVPVNNAEMSMPDAYFTWPFADGMLPFLIRHTPQYFLYTIGLACILFALFARIQLVAGRRLPLESQFNAMGKLSLTCFALSLYIFLIPVQLSLEWFCLLIAPILLGVLAGFWAWHAKGRRRCSLEWFMDLYVNGILQLLKRRSKPESPEVRRKS